MRNERVELIGQPLVVERSAQLLWLCGPRPRHPPTQPLRHCLLESHSHGHTPLSHLGRRTRPPDVLRALVPRHGSPECAHSASGPKGGDANWCHGEGGVCVSGIGATSGWIGGGSHHPTHRAALDVTVCPVSPPSPHTCVKRVRGPKEEEEEKLTDGKIKNREKGGVPFSQSTRV